MDRVDHINEARHEARVKLGLIPRRHVVGMEFSAQKEIVVTARMPTSSLGSNISDELIKIFLNKIQKQLEAFVEKHASRAKGESP